MKNVYPSLTVIAALLLLTSCGGGSTETTVETPQNVDEQAIGFEVSAEDGEDSEAGGTAEETPRESFEESFNTVFPPDASDISDNLDVYVQDGYALNDVIRIDLKTNTVAGVCVEGDLSGCTFADVLADTTANDQFKVDIPVQFVASDFPDDGAENNAELRQRGGGARFAPQKSFRVKLDDKDTLWRGERHLLLNKHPFERHRIRNKLSFDLMSRVPHLPSFRTQFVNLWIDDGEGPVNNGLYTHIERGDERYLERHGLAEGNLYQASLFEFTQSNIRSLLIDDEGEPIHESTFETILEIESGDDHRNLLEMINALHDPELPFNEFLERYFNENNVLTWVTVNFLLGQKDVTRHNYFLYNPEESEKFYFLPWDYDLAFQQHILPENDLSSEALRLRLESGYAFASTNDFLDRYFRQPGIHDRIVEAAAEIRASYMDDATITAIRDELSAAIAPYASAEPDLTHNPFFNDNNRLDAAERISFNENAIQNSFLIPMPPRLYAPELSDGQWRFSWRRAHSPIGDALSYQLQIANSPDFAADSIVANIENIADTNATVEQLLSADSLRSGTHYVRVLARASSEPQIYWQIADNVLRQNNQTYYGVLAFGVE
jgi:hypothetical protein